MKTSGSIGTVVKQIADGVNASVSEYLKNNKSSVDEALKDINKGSGSLIDVAKTLVTCTKAEDGTFYPDVIVRFSIFEASNSVEVSIRSKLKADLKTTASKTLKFDEKFLEKVVAFFLEQEEVMYRKACAVENIEALNAKFDQICTDAATPFKVSFAVGNDFINSISDDSIVFGVSVTQANKVASLAIMAEEGDEYANYVAEQAKNSFVEAVKAAGTTVNFVKAKEPNVTKITDFSSKMSVHKLIRKTYTKSYDKTKAGVVYYHDKESNVFALLNKAEDGKVTTLLSPFNTETLEKVDVKIG